MSRFHTIARLAAVTSALSALTACGGGGSGGPSGSFSITPTTIDVTAKTTDGAPIGTATISLRLSSPTNVYAVGNSSHNGIASVTIPTSSGSTATLDVQFKAPATLGPGTYTDSITLRMCFDTACNEPLSGGPVTITTNYTVTAAPSVSVNTTTPAVSATTTDASGPTYAVPLTISNPPPGGVYVTVSNSTNGIQSVSAPSGATASPQVSLNFAAPKSLGPGTYTDFVMINVCGDQACTMPLSGSPINLTTTYTVTTPTLAATNQIVLSHDVIDAKYSRALDAVVMVSSYPSNALYLYDIKTQTEVSQPLNKLPTAVAISPDGLYAAVGHDALISYVDLATLTQANPPAPVQLNVSAAVFDLALDGQGYVHAVPSTGQWVNIHSVNIATNVETLSTGMQIFAGSHAKLQPGTTYLYSADNGLSPSSLTKWDVSSGTAAYLYQISGINYAICGNLWFSDDDVTTYTACGNVFRASATQSQDMTYSGSLTLVPSTYGTQLISVDESSLAKEILGIEESQYECGPNGTPANCVTYVAVYDSVYLGQTALYALPSITVAGQAYPQRGLFVFHSADGTKRFVISMLYGEPNPATQYYLSTF